MWIRHVHVCMKSYESKISVDEWLFLPYSLLHRLFFFIFSFRAQPHFDLPSSPFEYFSIVISVCKYELGGWAPPTELSQLSGAAAHTYTWFSLTPYLLEYNVRSKFSFHFFFLFITFKWFQFLFVVFFFITFLTNQLHFDSTNHGSDYTCASRHRVLSSLSHWKGKQHLGLANDRDVLWTWLFSR